MDYRAAAAAECAYQAAADMFPWLSLAQIRTPPRQMFDAKLARQVAIHIMAGTLQMQQRAIARLQGRQRTSIHFALRAVQERLEHPVFAAAYEVAVATALRLHDQQREKAAA